MHQLHRPARYLHLRLPEPVVVSARLLIAVIVVAGLYYGKDILVPLALAALLAFLLDPLVAWLRRRRVPRGAAVAVVTVSTLALLAGGSVMVGQQLIHLGKNLPQYQSNIETKLRGLRHRIAGDVSLHSASALLDSVGHEVTATRQALGTPTPGGGSAKPTKPLVVELATDLSPVQALRGYVMPVIEPLTTAGIAVVLLVFMLLERNEWRDRLMRLVGGDLHHLNDALSEAARRVSRYLVMQVLVNAAYSLPLALGLWWIGVPGALLWGVLAGLLRFVPFLGPMVAAAFPMTLAFAVDPGWDMLLWTATLLLVLELVSNNLIEPWLYGSSTGLAAVAVLLSAAFWTVLWGPVGLVLSTPVTVCLVVLGRHLPHLRILDLLLGSEAVFEPPMRLYQRLLSVNLEEAADLAEAAIATDGLTGFYSDVAIPALGMAAADNAGAAKAEHRLRVTSGMALLLRELQHDTPAAPDGTPREALCIGLRWEADALAANMLAHTLANQKVVVQSLPGSRLSPGQGAVPEIGPNTVVCLSTFHPEPQAMILHVCRRLQQLHPGVRVVLALWHAPAGLREPGAAAALGVTAIATTLTEAVARVETVLHPRDSEIHAAMATFADRPMTQAALSGPLTQLGSARPAEPSRLAAQRAAEAFGTALGFVWWADGEVQVWHTQPIDRSVKLGPRHWPVLHDLLASRDPVIVPDATRDPRLGDAADDTCQNPPRLFAAVPIFDLGGTAMGALGVMDASPRPFDEHDQRSLEALARDAADAQTQHMPAPDPPAAATGASAEAIAEPKPGAGGLLALRLSGLFGRA